MVFAIVMTVLVGYLLGNLNGAVCMSHLVAHEDVRSRGSGNAGLTNFARNYGGLSSLGVVLIDGSKAVVACLLGGLMLQNYLGWLAGMAVGGAAVMLGHDFPALLGFKGGKGILSGAVISFMLDWRIGLILLGVFVTLYLISGYVSLGSVFGSLTFGVCFVLFHSNDPVVMFCGAGMSALAVFMHRGNVARLLKGQERKTNLFKKGTKK